MSSSVSATGTSWNGGQLALDGTAPLRERIGRVLDPDPARQYSKRSLVQMPCMISIVSRTCWWRRGKMCDALAAASSSGIRPDPMPTLTLPVES
jgi:hypothetical protein